MSSQRRRKAVEAEESSPRRRRRAALTPLLVALLASLVIIQLSLLLVHALLRWLPTPEPPEPITVALVEDVERVPTTERTAQTAKQAPTPAPRAAARAPSLAPARSREPPSPFMRMRGRRPEPAQQPRQAVPPSTDVARLPEAVRGERPHTLRPLDAHDFDQIYGDEASRQRQAARSAPSRRRGQRSSTRWARVRSALASMVPEVRPGNQVPLGARADAFSIYIARMHETIHELWGFGFLRDLDSEPNDHPLNDMGLWAMIEIVVQPDGDVAKATLVKPSGKLPFDSAALDAVFSAAPYPASPRAIRSADGNVYVHWRFHRNHRQCGTFGVDPYILTKPGEEPVDQGHAKSSTPNVGSDSTAQFRPVRRVAETPRHAPETASGRDASRKAEQHVGKKDDPRALAALNSFLEGFRRGDASAMAAVCLLPFSALGKSVTGSRDELRRMLRDLLAESPEHTTDQPELMTLAQARRVLGRLPRGASYGDGSLVARIRLGSAAFIAILRRVGDAWAVAGLNR